MEKQQNHTKKEMEFDCEIEMKCEVVKIPKMSETIKEIGQQIVLECMKSNMERSK